MIGHFSDSLLEEIIQILPFRSISARATVSLYKHAEFSVKLGSIGQNKSKRSK